jgi:hypothetical protein
MARTSAARVSRTVRDALLGQGPRVRDDVIGFQVAEHDLADLLKDRGEHLPVGADGLGRLVASDSSQSSRAFCSV